MGAGGRHNPPYPPTFSCSQLINVQDFATAEARWVSEKTRRHEVPDDRSILRREEP